MCVCYVIPINNSNTTRFYMEEERQKVNRSVNDRSRGEREANTMHNLKKEGDIAAINKMLKKISIDVTCLGCYSCVGKSRRLSCVMLRKMKIIERQTLINCINEQKTRK